MSSPPLRVIYLTRRHVAGVLLGAVFLAAVWAALLTRRAAFTQGEALSLAQPVRQVPAAKGRVALTVNVDWGNEVIPGMLDTFDRHGVKATFFLTGRWAKAFPEMAAEIAARGHEIGNHGGNHAHPTHLSDGQLHEHIGGNVETLRTATGVEPVPLYAPPYGEQDARVVKIAANLGHMTTLWTLDTIDWQNPPPQTIVRRVVPRATDGAIVLMHPKEQTLEALEEILEGLKERGFDVVPLWKMILEAGAPSLAPSG